MNEKWTINKLLYCINIVYIRKNVIIMTTVKNNILHLRSTMNIDTHEGIDRLIEFVDDERKKISKKIQQSKRAIYKQSFWNKLKEIKRIKKQINYIIGKR